MPSIDTNGSPGAEPSVHERIDTYLTPELRDLLASKYEKIVPSFADNRFARPVLHSRQILRLALRRIAESARSA